MAGFRLTSSSHNVNLWIVPLKMSLAAIALFGITITPDMLAAYHVIHIPDWFTMGGIDDARAILSAMLGCVSTVLALIFSVALLVLSMVANLFGHRCVLASSWDRSSMCSSSSWSPTRMSIPRLSRRYH